MICTSFYSADIYILHPITTFLETGLYDAFDEFENTFQNINLYNLLWWNMVCSLFISADFAVTPTPHGGCILAWLALGYRSNSRALT